MTALVASNGFDLEIFAEHLSRRLPAYAIPVFIRLCRSLDATETFKQKKQQLMREGFDPAIVADPLFLKDPADGHYHQIDEAAYGRIARGIARL